MANSQNKNLKKSESSTDSSNCSCIRPCYLGEEVQINQDLIMNGLHAISLKRDREGNVEKFGNLQSRQSFRDLFRPDLSSISNFKVIDLEEDFHQHCNAHGTYCKHLHGCRDKKHTEANNPTRCLLSPVNRIPRYPSYECLRPMTNGKIQLNKEFELDLDLSPEYRIRKSPAEFCIKGVSMDEMEDSTSSD